MGLEFNPDMLMTIGTDKLEIKFKLKNNEDIKLIIWDVCGTERQRSTAMKSISSFQGIILFFNLANKK